jgi:hypothetical protein
MLFGMGTVATPMGTNFFYPLGIQTGEKMNPIEIQTRIINHQKHTNNTHLLFLTIYIKE